MIENTIYFGKDIFYDVIRSVGGVWTDTKQRPIVCLIKLPEDEDIYWAVPMGNWNHRDDKAKARIESYIEMPEDKISSCFYHVGNTTTKSIFFISDIVPITDKYIEREYMGWNSKAYIIKNQKLLKELHRKVRRILFYEDKRPNYFRQHITDIKNYLITEIEEGKNH